MPFHSHIEGLRAVAVLLVVLHHIGLSPQGYLGVDIFFVISGFLITSLLALELQDTGGINLRNFYMRRIRRILPLALVVIAVSVFAVWVLGSGQQAKTSAEAGLYATFFLANFYFYSQTIDYFANPDPSIFQHFWSLSVEEQFYVIWPILLLGLFIASQKRITNRLLLFLLFLVGMSLSLAVLWNGSSSPVAYFNTASRFWELGLGALLALFVSQRKGIRRKHSFTTVALLFVLGVSFLPLGNVNQILIIAFAVVFALILIVFSLNSDHPVLSHPFLVRIGKRSYGWYLWHWPILILFPPSGVLESLGNVLLSYILAEFTFVVIENPIRYSVRMTKPRFAFSSATAAAVILAILMTSISTQTLKQSDISAEPSASPSQLASPSSTPSTLPSESATSLPKPTRTPKKPFVQELVGPLNGDSYKEMFANLQSVIRGAVAADEFPLKTEPRIGDALRDRSPWFENGCSVDFADDTNPICEGGDVNANRLIVLYGDSHATMWMPAFDAMCKAAGWKIRMFAKLACPLVEETIWSYQLNRPFEECQRWQSKVLSDIENLQPEIIVVTDQWKPAVKDGKIHDAGVVPLWQRAFEPAMKKLAGFTDRLILLENSPSLSEDPVSCITMRDPLPLFCMPFTEDAARDDINSIEKRGVEAAGGEFISVVKWACTNFCPTVIGGRIAYFDRWHFTNTFVMWLKPLLKLALKL